MPGGRARDKVTLAVHDPAWQRAFASEASAIRAALDDLPIRLHHIGSTAIPDILAKPIIDLLGEVADPGQIDARQDALEGLGYEAMGAFGIAGRRYFRKFDAAGRRTHHLHVFAVGSPHIARHLAFRDYLRAHPRIAAAYSDLKSALVAQTDGQAGSYMDGKDPFIQRTEQDAIAWYRRIRQG